ncbi:MAG: autotransporter outer membrane beta-barrel domain-containing protein [Rhodocyclaceae bacterium]
MNKAYRSLWNSHRQTWIAASETTRARSSGSCRSVAAPLAALAMLASGSVMAGDRYLATAGQSQTVQDQTLSLSASSDTALRATGAAATITATGFDISSTTYDNSVAKAESGGQISLIDSSVRGKTSITATGMGSKVRFDNVDMTTDTTLAAAIAANGATIELKDTTLTGTNASYSNTFVRAYGVAGQVSHVIIDGSTLSAGGRYANVVSLERYADADIANAKIINTGSGGYGVWLSDPTTTARLTNTDVTTSADSGVAVVNQGGGDLTMTGGTVSTSGYQAHGLYADGGSNATTQHFTAQGVTVNTTGVGAAVYGRGNTLVDVQDSTVNASADGTHGLYVTTGAASMKVSGTQVSMTGKQASAATISNNAAFAMEGGALIANGENATGLNLFGSVAGVSLTPTLTGTRIEAMSGTAINVRGANADVVLDGVTVDAARLLRVSNYGDTVAAGQVNVAASNDSVLSGDILLDSSSGQASLALQSGSRWNGAASNATRVSLDGTSQWNVTGDSTVGTLYNDGIVSFNTPTGDVFKTLTVTGDYTGNGGTLAFNTRLSDDSSATDRMAVLGNTSGQTNVVVCNANGAGDATSKGIELISVGGSSDGDFSLQGRAVAGLYEYKLYKGSEGDAADGNWYLRSVKDDQQGGGGEDGGDTGPIDPPDGGDGGLTPDPGPDGNVTPPEPEPLPQPQVMRPEPGAYLANQSIVRDWQMHTLRDRVGEPQNDPSANPAAVWLRVVHDSIDNTAGAGELAQSTAATQLHGGGDIATWRDGAQALHVGAMLSAGTASSDVRADSNGARASGKVDGYAAGMYATWFADEARRLGAYVDTWVQYGWYRNKVGADAAATQSYDSRAWTASAETGYAFVLGSSTSRAVLLEPQAQLAYNYYRADALTDDAGTRIDGQNGGQWRSRLGVRLSQRQDVTPTTQLQPFVEVNWWHVSGADQVAFDGARAVADGTGNRFELKAGIEARLGENVSAWGRAHSQWGGNYRDVGATVGVKYRW